MAKARQDQSLIPSVLDRLIDDEPEVRREAGKPRSQVLRELIQTVRRDLENLLNTRRRWATWPSDLEELSQSLVAYGLPDVLASNLGSPEGREIYRRQIERTIRTFEPRFMTVRVELLDETEPIDRSLRFRVDALLRVQPSPEPVVFDSQLDPSTGTVTISGAAR